VSGNRFVIVMAALMLAVTDSAARAEISIDFVTIGNAGNAADTRYYETGFGAVDYVYAIGKYEVTAGQYMAFLNAVATTDTYGLYNTSMTEQYGCQIERHGESGNYTYSVAADRAKRPVNYVSWGDAARFMNWLHNGQPTGAQGAGTTEGGAYTLDGATTNDELMAVTRNADARYWIPTENEWYKAAYYDPNKSGGPGYWDYATGSDTTPSNQLTSPDPGNNANFRVRRGSPEYTVGDPYWTTEVGAFTNSESPGGDDGPLSRTAPRAKHTQPHAPGAGLCRWGCSIGVIATSTPECVFRVAPNHATRYCASRVYSRHGNDAAHITPG
jgi:formylglycine-generating enzyme